MVYYTRDLEKRLAVALRQFPVVLVTGPRQSGKSTLLRHCLPEAKHERLDDPLTRTRAAQDPELFLDGAGPGRTLVIDEIQYAPQLLDRIKLRVDADRRRKARFALTGSAPLALMQGVTESLAGRVGILELPPFSWRETRRAKWPDAIAAPVSDPMLLEQVLTGFYPEFLVTPDLDRALWFGSYLNTYLERDVRHLRQIGDLGRFQQFLALLATRAGNLINLSDLARTCGVSQPTAKDWISVLEATFVVRLLRPFHGNRGKRLVKTPKLYFMDTGLLCHLLGIDTPERLLKSAERGHVFENMMVADAVKQLAAIGARRELSFYRTAAGVEVDLLMEGPDGVDAFEFKFSKTPASRWAAPLRNFAHETKVRSCTIFSLQPASAFLDEQIQCRPWWEFTIDS